MHISFVPVMQPPPQSIVGHLIIPEGNLCPSAVIPLSSLPSKPLVTTSLLLVSMDLPSLEISYQ